MVGATNTLLTLTLLLFGRIFRVADLGFTRNSEVFLLMFAQVWINSFCSTSEY